MTTCWCISQGINRLGKAPPRPGSLRPPDPNRNKTLDVFSEGTEGDADYMRMVQDVSFILVHLRDHSNSFTKLWTGSSLRSCARRREGRLVTAKTVCRLRTHREVSQAGSLGEEVGAASFVCAHLTYCSPALESSSIWGGTSWLALGQLASSMLCSI